MTYSDQKKNVLKSLILGLTEKIILDVLVNNNSYR